MAVCPQVPHGMFTAVVDGSHRGGGYELTVSHRHSGDMKPCRATLYKNLTWTELVDVLLAELEERRPGTHPGGWEQLSLDSQPAWHGLSASGWSIDGSTREVTRLD